MNEDQERAAALRRRYSAWCCRHAGAMQCNPAAVGAFIILVALAAGTAEVHMHWTGFMHVVTDVAAVLALAAAGLLAWGAMRILSSGQPKPAREPEYESPVILAAQALTPADLAADEDKYRYVYQAADEPDPALRAAAPETAPDMAVEAPDMAVEAPDMAVEADRLRDGTLDLVVSPHGTIVELPETDNEDAP